jgi:hypothetical protein
VRKTSIVLQNNRQRQHRTDDRIIRNGRLAVARGRNVLTTKADFTDEEWARLERAPIVAGMAISLADPGGPIEAIKESMAALRTLTEPARGGGQSELVESIAKSVAEKTRQRKSPLGDFKPRGGQAGEQILEELRAVHELVTQKATPDEAEAFRQWLLTAAQRAAEAAKEGGFLGFKAERVSAGEQAMLDRLREVLSSPA